MFLSEQEQLTSALLHIRQRTQICTTRNRFSQEPEWLLIREGGWKRISYFSLVLITYNLCRWRSHSLICVPKPKFLEIRWKPRTRKRTWARLYNRNAQSSAEESKGFYEWTVVDFHFAKIRKTVRLFRQKNSSIHLPSGWCNQLRCSITCLMRDYLVSCTSHSHWRRDHGRYYKGFLEGSSTCLHVLKTLEHHQMINRYSYHHDSSVTGFVLTNTNFTENTSIHWHIFKQLHYSHFQNSAPQDTFSTDSQFNKFFD